MVFRVNEKNDIFWFERGSGFGELGGTPPSRISRSTPPPPLPGRLWCNEAQVSPFSKKNASKDKNQTKENIGKQAFVTRILLF